MTAATRWEWWSAYVLGPMQSDNNVPTVGAVGIRNLFDSPIEIITWRGAKPSDWYEVRRRVGPQDIQPLASFTRQPIQVLAGHADGSTSDSGWLEIEPGRKTVIDLGAAR